MVKTNKTRQLQLKCYSAICLFSVKCSWFLELKRLKSLDKVLGGVCIDLIQKNQRWSHSNLNCAASKFAFSEDVKTFLKDCCSGVCFSTSRMLTMKGGSSSDILANAPPTLFTNFIEAFKSQNSTFQKVDRYVSTSSNSEFNISKSWRISWNSQSTT